MGPGIQLANIGNMPDVQQSSAPQRSPGKKKGWLALGFALVLGAVGLFAWVGQQRPGRAAESTLALETFVVNLTGSGQRAYLRIGITLGLAPPLSTRSQAEAAPTALVRDTILAVLANAKPEELLGSEGKRRLKGELLKALQERVPQMAVQNVYFTEFLVQM